MKLWHAMHLASHTFSNRANKFALIRSQCPEPELAQLYHYVQRRLSDYTGLELNWDTWNSHSVSLSFWNGVTFGRGKATYRTTLSTLQRSVSLKKLNSRDYILGKLEVYGGSPRTKSLLAAAEWLADLLAEEYPHETPVHSSTEFRTILTDFDKWVAYGESKGAHLDKRWGTPGLQEHASMSVGEDRVGWGTFGNVLTEDNIWEYRFSGVVAAEPLYLHHLDADYKRFYQ
jgi:hypothetical protein